MLSIKGVMSFRTNEQRTKKPYYLKMMGVTKPWIGFNRPFTSKGPHDYEEINDSTNEPF